ncbi:MAG: hypothetical protein WCS52_02015 [bacterium]
MEAQHSLNLVTSYNIESGIIAQRLEGVPEYFGTLTSWVCNTRDAGIRKALIDMGWTPPAEKISESPRYPMHTEYQCSHCGTVSLRQPRNGKECPSCLHDTMKPRVLP